jgi:hypothetical protein
MKGNTSIGDELLTVLSQWFDSYKKVWHTLLAQNA